MAGHLPEYTPLLAQALSLCSNIFNQKRDYLHHRNHAPETSTVLLA